LWSVISVYYARHRAASFYHPLTLYLAFHGLLFVIRAWTKWYYDYDAIYRGYHYSPDMTAKILAILVVNLGLIVFTFVCLNFGNLRFVKKYDWAHEREREEIKQAFWVVFAILAPIIIYSLYTNWHSRASDLEGLEFDEAGGVWVSAGSNGYEREFHYVCVSMLPLLVWLYRFRWWTFLPMLGYALLASGGGGRGPIIMASGTLALLYLYDKRKLWPDRRIVGLSLLVIAMFSAVGADRGRAVRELFVKDSSRITYDQGQLKPLEGMDLGNLEFVEFLTNAVPRMSGTHGYFINLAQIATEPIPRSLWKDKPPGEPIKMVDLFKYGTPIGMTRSIPGEGWLQFGFVGVIIWCALWGWALGIFYRRFVGGAQSAISVLSYCSLMAMMIVCYRDGLLISVLRKGLFVFLPILMLLMIIKLTGRRRLADFELIALARQMRGYRAASNKTIRPMQNGAGPRQTFGRNARQLQKLERMRHAVLPTEAK
jgi:oligosaccharide repeat unit polymerase